MAYENPSLLGSFAASTGLLQYQGVALSTNGLLINPTTSGAIIGVLVSGGTTGSTSAGAQTVQFGGIAKVLAGATAIDYMSALTFDTDGRAIAGTTNYQTAIALGDVTSTSTSAQVIPALILPHAGVGV